MMVSLASSGQEERGLSDILHKLSILAIDALVDELEKQGSLSAFRLASRGLRDIADASVRHARLTFRREDWQPHEEGQLPSLARWPRCSSVCLIYSHWDLHEPVGVLDAASLLSSAFAGLPLEARNRIHKLELDGDTTDMQDPGAVLASLLHHLPALRELEAPHLFPCFPALPRTSATFPLPYSGVPGTPLRV
ncbi:hypothetical protein Agub_g13984 [Astrephomene gubernaculifera]|uniref:Uncharacterized protein n=1 Tax=Astrephomene gubernaculifera TaxID=47775 RepID=A0AAD3E2T2_9CHLO|nr:hypothetical protein Agub_g13984 [Astrephomene gubernaculifera]